MDELYAEMSLQPQNTRFSNFCNEKDISLVPDIGISFSKHPIEFCKTLTPSDTSTQGGFSVSRRAAEKLFSSLMFLSLLAQTCLKRYLKCKRTKQFEYILKEPSRDIIVEKELLQGSIVRHSELM